MENDSKLRLEEIRTQRGATLAKLEAEISSYKALFIKSLISIVFALIAAIAASGLSALSFSSIPRIPKAYAYAVGILFSSFVGLSIVFALARRVYEQRKNERTTAIDGIRLSESKLFRAIEHDFQEIVKPRKLHV